MNTHLIARARAAARAGRPVRLRLSWLLMLGAVLLLLGCGRRQAQLQSLVDSRAYSDAVALAKGDGALETALAVAILTSTAGDDASALEVVETLQGAGGIGRDALKALSAERFLAGRLATVALMAPADVDAHAADRWAGDGFGDVRYAFIKRFYRDVPPSHLAAALLDIDPRVRRYAVSGIFERDDVPGAAEFLQTALRQDPAAAVRAAAAKAGPKLGPDALFLLKSALDETALGVRLAALQGLGALGTGAALERLALIARQEMGPMSVAAATELSRAGLAPGKERLAQALQDARPTIRVAAMLRLERARFEERSKHLAAQLSSRSPDVVLTAVRLLGRGAEHRPGILVALRRLAAGGGSAAAAARDALAVMGDLEAMADVKAALGRADETTLRQVLPRIAGSEGLRNELIALMGDERSQVRVLAAKTLLANPG